MGDSASIFKETGTRTSLRSRIVSALLVGAMPTFVLPALAAGPVGAPAARYSVTTTLVGKLLDDPAVNAVLKRMIP